MGNPAITPVIEYRGLWGIDACHRTCPSHPTRPSLKPVPFELQYCRLRFLSRPEAIYFFALPHSGLQQLLKSPMGQHPPAALARRAS
eukprot:8432272-Pyramimonas_sp.AAC.1